MTGQPLSEERKLELIHDWLEEIDSQYADAAVAWIDRLRAALAQARKQIDRQTRSLVERDEALAQAEQERDEAEQERDEAWERWRIESGDAQRWYLDCGKAERALAAIRDQLDAKALEAAGLAGELAGANEQLRQTQEAGDALDRGSHKYILVLDTEMPVLSLLKEAATEYVEARRGWRALRAGVQEQA